MPTPHPGDETQDQWLDRCIPQVLEEGTAEDSDQAVAICMQMWRDAKGESRPPHRLSVALEIKGIEDGEFEGHAAVFGNVDTGGDVVLAGAFKKSLARHRKNGTWPPMFWMHNPTQVPGAWKEITEDDVGLFVRGKLAATELGQEVRVLLQMKAVRGLSFGYPQPVFEYDKEGNRLLKEIDIWEASIVSLAMNPLARVTAVKARLSREGEYVPTEREVEDILRDSGCSRTTAQTVMARIFDVKRPGRIAVYHRRDSGGVEDVLERVRRTSASMLGLIP